MTEKQSNWGDILLKIVIAVVVPVTVAIIGIFGQTILSQAAQNQQVMERIARIDEAETAFRRDMFAELFTDYVDEISTIQKASQLDALTIKLELLSGNFTDFLAIRPLYIQLDRQIDRLLDPQDVDRLLYKDRLRKAGRAVRYRQVSRIGPRAVTQTLRIPLDFFNASTTYTYPKDHVAALVGEQPGELSPTTIEDIAREMSTIELNGITRTIEIRLSDPDQLQQQVRCEVSVSVPSFGSDIEVGQLQEEARAHFMLDDYSFPLESNIVLSSGQRLAMSIGYFDSREIEITLLLFHHAEDVLSIQEYMSLQRAVAENW